MNGECSEKLEIICKHGVGIASVVCSHLLGTKSPLGFIENSSNPNDLQGWCLDCETRFIEHNGMTAEFLEYNSAIVVCKICYQSIKSKHQM